MQKFTGIVDETIKVCGSVRLSLFNLYYTSPMTNEVSYETPRIWKTSCCWRLQIFPATEREGTNSSWDWPLAQVSIHLKMKNLGILIIQMSKYSNYSCFYSLQGHTTYMALLIRFYSRQKKISFHGIEYRVGAVVHTGRQNDLPVFSSIQEIFVFGVDKIYFLLKRLTTIAFSCHFHCYEVRLSAETQAILLEPAMLKMYLPMHTTKASSCLNGVLYVIPRYFIPQ